MLDDLEEVGAHEHLAARERDVEPAERRELVEDAGPLGRGHLALPRRLFLAVLDHAVAMDALLVAAIGQLEMHVQGDARALGLGRNELHQGAVAEAGVLRARVEHQVPSPDGSMGRGEDSAVIKFASASAARKPRASCAMRAGSASNVSTRTDTMSSTVRDPSHRLQIVAPTPFRGYSKPDVTSTTTASVSTVRHGTARRRG
jgi:hypothetical protein